VGPVPDVLADYASSKGTLADPRLKVLNATLTHPGTGAEVTAPVPPGTSMVLDVELAAAERLVRCGVLIQLVRSDGLVIFTGMSTLDGLAEVDLEPSDRLKARIAFQANTLRGTYILNLQLVDGLRQWPTAFINGLRSFVVTETSRIAGCAEILPSYDLTVTRASATGDPLAAAHRG
jgi:hypothetical protein